VFTALPTFGGGLINVSMPYSSSFARKGAKAQRELGRKINYVSRGLQGES
jgi:hypothetical protein